MRLPYLVVGLVAAFACKAADAPADDRESPAPAAGAKATKAEATERAPALPEPALIEPLGDPPSAAAPAVQVELPASPVFADTTAPDRHQSGAWSIAGLRKDLDARVAEGDSGVEVEVQGWVTKIYVAPECPEGEVCPPAKQPHLWITDTAADRGLKHALLVVGYRYTIPEWEAARWHDEPDVVLEVGKRYTFKGRVKQFSDTGFAHSEGLLEFVAYKPLDPATGDEQAIWVHPPGSPWHPLEIARQEAEEAALAGKLGAP